MTTTDHQRSKPKRTIPRSIARVHDRFPTMGTLGFAAERFAPYVHTAREGAHGHEHAEFLYIERGTARSLVDGVEYREQEGSVVVVPFGDSHELLTDREGIRVVNLYIDPRRCILPDLGDETRRLLEPLFPSGAAFAHKANLRMLVQPPSPDRLSAALELILREQASLEAAMGSREGPGCAEAEPGAGVAARGPDEADLGSAESMAAGLTLYLVELARGVREMIRAGSYGAAGMDADYLRRTTRPAERLRTALDFHPERPLELAAAAAGCAVSASHLCRSFKALTGLRPSEYLHRRRIERAMLLLEKGSDPIGEIAAEVGFNDLAQFNEKFKKLTGGTPKSYREYKRKRI
jgi:AraC-like DNA-binding protein/mannose-6-phosphate isomerase-like protein (cupin superfamily)